MYYFDKQFVNIENVWMSLMVIRKKIKFGLIEIENKMFNNIFR